MLKVQARFAVEQFRHEIPAPTHLILRRRQASHARPAIVLCSHGQGWKWRQVLSIVVDVALVCNDSLSLPLLDKEDKDSSRLTQARASRATMSIRGARKPKALERV